MTTNTTGRLKLAAPGPQVADDPDYSADLALLHQLEERLALMRSEHDELRGRLAFALAPAAAEGREGARAFLVSGRAPNHSERLSGEQLRELELRTAIFQCEALVKDMRGRTEMSRDRARTRILTGPYAERVAALRADWQAAVDRLGELIRAEDAMHAELVAGGFGRSEPQITVLLEILNRDALRDYLAQPQRVAA